VIPSLFRRRSEANDYSELMEPALDGRPQAGTALRHFFSQDAVMVLAIHQRDEPEHGRVIRVFVAPHKGAATLIR